MVVVVDEVVLTVQLFLLVVMTKLHFLMMELVLGCDPVERLRLVVLVIPESVHMLAQVAMTVVVIRHWVCVQRHFSFITMVWLHASVMASLRGSKIETGPVFAVAFMVDIVGGCDRRCECYKREFEHFYYIIDVS